MKKYTVLSTITGRGGKQFKPGDEVTEQQLVASSLRSLVSRNFIRLKQWDAPTTGKIKLAIVTSVWGRPEIFRMFCLGVKKLIDVCSYFEISLVVSGSELDSCYSNYKEFKMYIDHFVDVVGIKAKYIEIPNEPLAAKVNATTYACRNLGVHYVLCMGSDDIISPELLNEYAKHMRKGIDFIGVSDFYFYDTVSKQALYWGGYREQYRKGHSAGAARALSSRLLEQWDWMPWENKDSHVLDKSMQDKLKVTPHTIEVFNMRSKGLFALDIKSSTNMTPFKQWDNSEFIDVGVIKKQFPYIF